MTDAAVYLREKIDELREENGALRAELDRNLATMVSLVNEVQRLRKALVEITNCPAPDPVKPLRRLAQDALRFKGVNND